MDSTKASPSIGGYRERRLAVGLSQQELAHQAGCSIAYIRVIERGYTPAKLATSPVFGRVEEALRLAEASDEDGATTPG